MKKITIREGTSIFVPANADHRFHGNKQDLVIFYALGGFHGGDGPSGVGIEVEFPFVILPVMLPAIVLPLN